MGRREVLHLTPADGVRQAWRNGAGASLQLALWPEQAAWARGDFDWRIARAVVARPGPFSAFPGFERIVVPIAGAGLELDHGDAAPRARLRALEPYCFAGEWPARAVLVDGPVEDLSVLVRRGVAGAQVQVVRLGARRVREALEPGHAFAHLLAGRATARVTGEERPFELAAGESLWARGLAGGEELELAGQARGCAALLVRVGPARG